MEHFELVNEMPSIERMTTQDRLKHARKRRSQQLKKWNQYEKHLDKESSKRKKKQEPPTQSSQRRKPKKSERVRFVANIALLESAARNDLDEVRRLLENKVTPDVTNEDGLTALHQCCIDDNEEMLKLLMEFGANVNACDSEMWTPLHAAATCGHVTLCKHLIDNDAKLLAVNADGNMPYDICEDEVTLDYIETEMAKRGITQEQIDETRLTTERQMLNDLKDHAAKGGDLDMKDATGATMLHVAAANGYLDVADFLLDNHVSVDGRDQESWQPIHAASYWGQLEILELLVQNGADLDSKTKSGETPFDLCEDPDIKQRILDMKDEIETNKASRHRAGSSRRHKNTSRNASIRRTSLRGEKSNLFKKEAHEEALHFGLRLMQDEEELMEMEEEKENLPATNIDDVSITFEDHDPVKPSIHPRGNKPQSEDRSDPRPTGGDSKPPVDTERNNVTPTNKPTPAPRHTSSIQGRQTGSFSSRPSETKQQSNSSQGPQEPESRTDGPEDSRRDALDAQLQSMFLESLPNRGGSRPGGQTSVKANNPGQSQLHFYPPPMMERTKNGHNNNNNSTSNSTTTPTGSVQYANFREGQLRRFVAPPSTPAVGPEDEKQKCCVIL